MEKEKSILICKTPQNIIQEYIELIHLKNKGLNSKKQKENDRKINMLCDLHHNVIKDSKIIISFDELKCEYEKEVDYLMYLQNYIKNQVLGIYNILKSQNYLIEKMPEMPEMPENIVFDNYITTDKWLIASNIHEIHPLVITDFIVNNNDILNENIIGLLSLWSDIKIKNIESGEYIEKPIEPFFVKEINNLYDKYFDLENKYNIEHKTNNNITEEYLGNIFEIWANECNNIEDCKYFIQEQLNKRDISLGDFTKGCLKIVAISKELEKIFGTMNDYLILSQKLGKIENMLCKFIVTSQSLYIN
jgi:hypothetical protein